MAGFSDSRENAWLDHIFKNTAVTSPTNVYIAAHTADPGETGTNEVSGGSYARQKIGSGGVTTFSAAASRTSSNVDAITFPQATANWGTITHLSIWDSLTSGTMIAAGALDSSQTINNGDTLNIPAGDLDVTLSTTFATYAANKILDHELRNTAWTSPTNVWCSLHSADPGGTGADELSGNGYARQQLGSGGDSEFSSAASGTTDNDSEISFPAASGGSQGTATHVGIFDASTSGNFICSGALSASRTINENDQASFAAGDLDFTLD